MKIFASREHATVPTAGDLCILFIYMRRRWHSKGNFLPFLTDFTWRQRNGKCLAVLFECFWLLLLIRKNIARPSGGGGGRNKLACHLPNAISFDHVPFFAVVSIKNRNKSLWLNVKLRNVIGSSFFRILYFVSMNEYIVFVFKNENCLIISIKKESQQYLLLNKLFKNFFFQCNNKMDSKTK